MYTLKAIADSHPMNWLSYIVRSTLKSSDLRASLFRQYVADFQRDPTIVTKRLFWESMLIALREYWHRECFGIQNPKNMKWELPRQNEVILGFETIRYIYEDQFRRMSEDKVIQVYHEGCGAHPLKSFVVRLLGLGFCDLDSKRYHQYLNPEE